MRSRSVLAALVTAICLLGSSPAVASEDGTIHGVVTDSAGLPIEGLLVLIERWEEPFNFGVALESDGSGRYSADVPAGPYKVLFTNRPSSERTYLGEWYPDADNSDGAAILAVESGKAIEVNATLLRGSTISGRVTDAGRAPIEGIHVTPLRSADDEFPLLGAISMSDGSFTIPQLPAGRYALFFSDYCDDDFECGPRRYLDAFYEDSANFAGATHIDLEAERDLREISMVVRLIPQPDVVLREVRVESDDEIARSLGFPSRVVATLANGGEAAAAGRLIMCGKTTTDGRVFDIGVVQFADLQPGHETELSLDWRAVGIEPYWHYEASIGEVEVIAIADVGDATPENNELRTSHRIGVGAGAGAHPSYASNRWCSPQL